MRSFRYTASYRHSYILIFKCIEGVGVGDYSSCGGGGRTRKIEGLYKQHCSSRSRSALYQQRRRWLRLARFLLNCPRPLSSFDTHLRWKPVTQSARSRRSYGKIEDCEQSKNTSHAWYLTSDVHTPTSDVRCPIADVRCVISYVRNLMSDIQYALSDVWYPRSDVRCPMSDVWYPISHV